MKRTILYLIVFLISINFTVAQENTWKYKDRTDFIVECVKAASEGMSTDSAKYYCYCMLSEIEEKYPNPADAAKLTPETFNSPEWKVIVRACLGSYWTSYQRNDFMTSCIDAAKPAIGEEKAKAYCDCMMYKLENKYNSYAEASKLTVEELKTPAWKKVIQSCLQ